MNGWILEDTDVVSDEERSDYIFETPGDTHNPLDEIKYELRTLGENVNDIMKLLQSIKINRPVLFGEESQIFFYKPGYICIDDYVRVNKKNKLELRVTLLGIIGEEVRLYILGIHKTYLTHKIKTIVHDTNDRVLIGTFESHPVEENCYCLKDKSYYQKLKFPLYFEISTNI